MLIGMRVRKDTDKGEATVFEYRMGQNGRVALTVGDPNEIVSEITLGSGDNTMIEDMGGSYGVRMPPFAKGAEKTYTPADGVSFILALLVQFSRNNGYSWAEPILS
jgi:hypothetical protein